VPLRSNPYSKLLEFRGSLEQVILSEAYRDIGTCNDYPEMEYSQVAGSGEHPQEWMMI